MSDINASEARRLAVQLLSANDDGAMRIDDRQTTERDFGWVFIAESDAYLRTGDPKEQIPGVGPIVVARDRGDAAFVPTNRPPEVGIEKFASEWRARQGY